MRLKRFEAPTMTEALRQIREEFGPDAVILSARSLRRFPSSLGFARTRRVEVTAAVDAAEPSAAASSSAGLCAGGDSPVEPEGLRRGRLPVWSSRLRALAGRLAAENPVAPPRGRAGLDDDFRRRLIAGGVEPEIAGLWVERLTRSPAWNPASPPERQKEAAAEILEDLGVCEFTAAEASPRRSAFVGGPGAGKTTLAAKLAAREVLRRGRRVALLSLDDRRIGGAEELRSYAAALRVPFAAARSAEEAVCAIRNWSSREWVLIDTAGVGPGEDERRLENVRRLSAIGCREIHLVVPAGLRDADHRRLIGDWTGHGVRSIAFTRLDETVFPGAVLGAARWSRLPLSWLGTGRRVPEDLAEHPLVWLTARLWPQPDGAETAEPAAAGDPTPVEEAAFVANRNSELYHRGGCKWAQRIKAGHLRRFASAAAAEAEGFQPCRTCISAESGTVGGRDAVGLARPRYSVRL
ncbi:MAG: hypothetical protein WHT06_05835 [Desulfobacterales bacterium]